MKNHIKNLIGLLFIILINVLILMPTNLMAQGDFGCGGDNPTEDCLLDSWVYLLVFLMLIISIYNWFKIKNLV